MFFSLLSADGPLWLIRAASQKEGGNSSKQITNIQIVNNNKNNNKQVNSPVELTHLFLNKDGTIDESLLFHAHSTSLRQNFKTEGGNGNVNKGGLFTKNKDHVFVTKNNTLVKAHAGSTVDLPCVVNKDSKFEMVSLETSRSLLKHPEAP